MWVQNCAESRQQSAASVNVRTLAPEIFDTLDDSDQTVESIPKPGIRERTAISRAFKQGMPVSEFDEDCDQIPNFDHLADLVEEHSHA
ncbi:ParA family chromosome partitioning ATPase [Haloarcula marismortui ATCC 33799]|uniref:ParA family chromosome partitioning ATPase n=1 Tax=Haloarcula marismortui ATCC 33799 TaxID=662475 RepID=M0JYE6_9EURY|nr:ParA family chromosome partitioning ATPase [Haloarcula californiae ATCC 33799]